MSGFNMSLFPPRVPLLCLQTVVGDVVRTLKVMYGSLDRWAALCFPVVLLREPGQTAPYIYYKKNMCVPPIYHFNKEVFQPWYL